MRFNVDKQKKRMVHKTYLRSRRGWMALSCGIIIFFTLFNIIFAVYGFADKSTFPVMDPMASDYGQKNMLFVWTVLIAVDVIVVFLWFIQHIIAVGITGIYSVQRINESLSAEEKYIEYCYQNAIGRSPGDRVVVRMPTDKVREIRIYKKDHMVEIYGEMSSVYYDDYAKRKTRANVDDFEESTFTIFDYFSPGLIPYLRETYNDRVRML